MMWRRIVCELLGHTWWPRYRDGHHLNDRCLRCAAMRWWT